jgi:translation initiation factor 1A
MPPKKGKGGKKVKKTKNGLSEDIERELVYKNMEDLQEYAQVEKLLGNCRCQLKCFDGIARLGHIRGSMTKKKIWIKTGNIVLVSLREYEDAKCDILYLYTEKEAKRLKNEGEIPTTIILNDVAVGEESTNRDIGFDFVEEGEEDDEDETSNDFKNNFEEKFDLI